MKNRNLFFGIICLLALQVGNLDAQNLTVEGNAGIGTDNPLRPLDVTASSFQSLVRLQNQSAFGYAVIDIFGEDGQQKIGFGYANPSAFFLPNTAYLNTGTGVPFLMQNNGGTDRLRINPNSTLDLLNGNVYVADSLGIGTANPSAKLDLNGNLRVRNRLDIDHKQTPAFGNMAGVDLGSDGILIETLFTESAGFHADGDRATIWSPGDSDRLLRVFDEDSGAAGERWYVDGDGDDFKASDANLKKDIKTLERSLEKVRQLRGVAFTWRKSKEELAKGDKETPSIGVIAQELEEVYPELVSTNDHGRKFVDYKGLAPILIEAVKEQQLEIDDKIEKIDWLMAENDAIKARLAKIEALLQGQSMINNSNISNTTTTLTNARLEQNQPNPFNGSTVIRYFIPEGVNQAELLITDLSGKAIKNVRLEARGEGQTALDATMLSSGNYQYSLILDGRLLDTKQMILTKN